MSSILKSQITDGVYIQLPQRYCDGAIHIKINGNRLIRYEYSLSGVDSTAGTYIVSNKMINITWNKAPIDSNQQKIYYKSGCTTNDSISVIVYDTNLNALPGTTLTCNTRIIGVTGNRGFIKIIKSDLSGVVKFSFVGYQRYDLSCNTINLTHCDSITVKLAPRNKRYIEQSNTQIPIRDLNANGFELYENSNFIQYLKVDLFEKLQKSGFVLRKAHFTKTEYQKILKL